VPPLIAFAQRKFRAAFGLAWLHAVENVGKSETHVIDIELKK
jgi:hypothetical protein